jgi:hypothetical protein
MLNWVYRNGVATECHLPDKTNQERLQGELRRLAVELQEVVTP